MARGDTQYFAGIGARDDAARLLSRECTQRIYFTRNYYASAASRLPPHGRGHRLLASFIERGDTFGPPVIVTKKLGDESASPPSRIAFAL